MQTTIKNDGQYPIKIMQRKDGGTPVNELNSFPDEYTEVFIQPGESLTVQGRFIAIEMEPNNLPHPSDSTMYIGGE